MPTNPNIILASGQGRPQSVDYNSARNVVYAGEALKSKQEQQDRQQAMQTQQAFQSALQQTRGDYDKAADLLDAQGLNTLGLREGMAKQRKAATDAATAHLTQLEKQNELMSGYAANITDQNTLMRYGPLLHQADPEMQIPMTYAGNEAYFQGLGSLGKTGQDVLNRAKDSLKSYKDGDYQKGFATAVWGSTSDEDLHGAIDFARTQHVPQYVINSLAPGGKLTPDVQARAQTVAMGPEKSAEFAQKSQATATDDARQAARDAQIASDAAANQKLREREIGIQAGNLAVRRQEASKSPTAAQGGGKSDVQETVAGMIDGSLPPVLPGRATKEYNAIMAESHRQHFDLAKAAQDWQATTKYLGTLNGAQQTLLRQATEQVAETVPLVRSLVTEWDSSGIPYLSAANLAAAKKGAYGNKAQSLANRLDAQIADMTSELGTVYKGGNSSTDESLKLAARNLQGDWSRKAALDALDQIEQNIKYRRNSMKLGAVTGGNNRYEPNLGGGSTKRQNWVFDSKGQLVPGP